MPQPASASDQLAQLRKLLGLRPAAPAVVRSLDRRLDGVELARGDHAVQPLKGLEHRVPGGAEEPAEAVRDVEERGEREEVLAREQVVHAAAIAPSTAAAAAATAAAAPLLSLLLIVAVG